MKFSKEEAAKVQQDINQAMRKRFIKQVQQVQDSEAPVSIEKPTLLSLEKLQRKLDLDRIMPEWQSLHHGTNNPFNWFKLLDMFSDNKVKQLCGSDAALYLAFLRMSSKFFFAISMINVGVLYLYLTGENDSSKIEDKDNYAMTALTILNITGVTWKVFIVYIVALGGVVALKIMLISAYGHMFHGDEKERLLEAKNLEQDHELDGFTVLDDKLQLEWKKLENELQEGDYDFRETELNDLNIEKHVVMIRGINKD